MRSMEEQLKAGITAGKLSLSGGYTAPQGLALPKPGTYTQDIYGITNLFKDRITPTPTENDRERLKEWYNQLELGGQPAFEWLQEAICRTSTKIDAGKRNVGYVIGILKQWSTFGYGSDFSTEQQKLFSKFEERFKCQLSEAGRKKLLALTDSYGLVEAVGAMFMTTDIPEVDRSVLIVDQMFKSLSKEG